MEEPNTSKQDILDLGPSLLEKPEEFSSASSSIPLAQKALAMPVSWSAQIQKKTANDYKRDRIEKYAEYFKQNEILPILKLVEAVKPKTLSFVVTDLRTWRLARIKKESFEELLKDIPVRYFCRRNFATWDILLLTEDIAKKLAGSNITTKFFRLQPEYRGKRRIKVTVFNISMQLRWAARTSLLSIYGSVESVTQIKSASGTAYGDYAFIVVLDRGGFQAIPHTKYRDQTMMVVVEGRRLLGLQAAGPFRLILPSEIHIYYNN